MGISATTGIISGINYEALVQSLMSVERRPIEVLESRQVDYQVKISSVLNLITKLSSYKSSLEALNSSEKFNTQTASVTKTSSNVELLTVTASSTATVGSYSLQVNQLAAASKKASKGWADQNTTVINSSGGTFKFKVGSDGAVTTISVSSTTTLQGLRDAINSADGGVTASIINDGTGSNPYRLILTANNTGSSNNIIITDDTTAQNLGLTDVSGTPPKIIEAAYAYTTNSYAGTVASNEGNNYTGTTNKTFLIEIINGDTPGSGNATYKYSIDGGITWLGYGGDTYDSTIAPDADGGAISIAADDTPQNIDGLAALTTTEDAKIKFTGGILAEDDKFSIDVFNPEMQEAKDAVIEVDNATIVKGTNTITDAIQGVTLNLLQTDPSESVTITVSSSTSSAKSNIESFVNSYNALYEFINDQLVYDPDTEAEADPLFGDVTLLEIRRGLGDVMTGTIPGLSYASYTNLSQIGITLNYKTGKLSLDKTELDTALSTDPDAVAKLFIGTATPTNQSITFVSKTADTLAGTYSIYISTAPEQAAVTGDNDLSSTGLGEDETLIFMYSTDYTSSLPTYKTLSVTLTSSSTINSIVSTLNSAFATNNVGLSASNDSDSGKLKITSTGYGADIWFQVTTDQGDDEDNHQIWDKSSNDTLSDAGVDIAGNINNHVGVGVGNILTAASGFAEEGLKISTTSNQTGGFGTITVSLGIADRLPSILDSYVDTDTGVLRSKESAMQDSVDYLEDRISIMEERLEDREQRYIEQFARLEVLLAKYSALSQSLLSQLANLKTTGDLLN